MAERGEAHIISSKHVFVWASWNRIRLKTLSVSQVLYEGSVGHLTPFPQLLSIRAEKE